MARSKEELRAARRLMKNPAGKFIPVDIARANNVPEWMTRAYQNNWYVVMVDDNAATTHGRATKALIQRHDDAPIHSWSELQSIKNEIFGKEVVAIEYYPKQSELSDKANIYWLWIFPEGVLPLCTASSSENEIIGCAGCEKSAIDIVVLQNDLNTALGMLADWCVSVERSEEWDENYTDVCSRDGPLRAMLDKAIIEARARRNH